MLIAHVHEFCEFDLRIPVDVLFLLPLPEGLAGFRDGFRLVDGGAAVW
jgi:hypothetical protein